METGIDPVDLQLAEQAAQWVQRLKRLEMVTPQDRDEFMAWVKESPAHVRELLLAVNVDDMLRGVDPEQLSDILPGYRLEHLRGK